MGKNDTTKASTIVCVEDGIPELELHRELCKRTGVFQSD